MLKGCEGLLSVVGIMGGVEGCGWGLQRAVDGESCVGLRRAFTIAEQLLVPPATAIHHHHKQLSLPPHLASAYTADGPKVRTHGSTAALSLGQPQPRSTPQNRYVKRAPSQIEHRHGLAVQTSPGLESALQRCSGWFRNQPVHLRHGNTCGSGAADGGQGPLPTPWSPPPPIGLVKATWCGMEGGQPPPSTTNSTIDAVPSVFGSHEHNAPSRGSLHLLHPLRWSPLPPTTTP